MSGLIISCIRFRQREILDGCSRQRLHKNTDKEIYGKAVFTLNALIGSKKVSQSVEVKIKKSKSARPAKGADISKMKLWKEKLQAGWYVFRAQLKYWWFSRKKWQKALWIALLALWLGMLISSIGNRPQKQTAPAEVQTAYLMR